MNKIIICFSFLLFSILSIAQTKESNLEKNLTGVQIGLFGADLYHEIQLSEKWALKNELSLYAGIWGGSLYDRTGFILYPSINVQPKYYYNINKRAQQGKNVKNNAANYFSLQARYTPNWFTISNYDDVEVYNQLSFIPTFGIRRNFAQNFNYEFKVGLGYGFTFDENKNTSGGVFDLGFKIGYDF